MVDNHNFTYCSSCYDNWEKTKPFGFCNKCWEAHGRPKGMENECHKSI